MGKSVDRKQVDEIKNDTMSKDFWRNNEHFADLFKGNLAGIQLALAKRMNATIINRLL